MREVTFRNHFPLTAPGQLQFVSQIGILRLSAGKPLPRGLVEDFRALTDGTRQLSLARMERHLQSVQPVRAKSRSPSRGQYLFLGGSEVVQSPVRANAMVAGDKRPRAGSDPIVGELTLKTLQGYHDELFFRNRTEKRTEEILLILRRRGLRHRDPKIVEKAFSMLISIVYQYPHLIRPEDIRLFLENGFSDPQNPFFGPHGVLAFARKRPDLFSSGDVLNLAQVVSRNFGEIAEALGFLLRERRFYSLRETVWSRLGLLKMEFHDGGSAISTIQPFFRGYLTEEHAPSTEEVSIEGSPFIRRELPLNAFLAEQGIEGTGKFKGRSNSYSMPDGRLLVLKYLREDQGEEDLVREIQWLDAIKRARLPLWSKLPEPLKTPAGELQAVQFGGKGVAIPFIAPQHYYHYLDDPALSDGDFLRGLLNGIHDIFLLARHGILHTVPMRLFHTREQEGNRWVHYDRGYFVSAPLIVFGLNRGMGRLDDWPSAIRFGNIGMTGLRDFEELASLSEILQDKYRWKNELFSADSGEGPTYRFQDLPNVRALLEAILLGNALHAAVLWIGNRLVKQRQGNPEDLWRDDRRLKKYAAWLLQVISTAYAARHDVSGREAMGIMRKRVNYGRLARQLAFFMTDAHAAFVREGADPKVFPTKRIFGGRTIVEGMGPYRRGSFHPRHGFIGPNGDPESRALGAVNAAYAPQEVERYIWAAFL